MANVDEITPAFMNLLVAAQVGISTEASLFTALSELVKHGCFDELPNAAKARCAQHLAEMLLAEGD